MRFLVAVGNGSPRVYVEEMFCPCLNSSWRVQWLHFASRSGAKLLSVQQQAQVPHKDNPSTTLSSTCAAYALLA